VPLHDDRSLFEFLVLEGAQAGLSWETILRKRNNYRKAFDNFDHEKIAAYDYVNYPSLLSDESEEGASCFILRTTVRKSTSSSPAFHRCQIIIRFCS